MLVNNLLHGRYFIRHKDSSKIIGSSSLFSDLQSQEETSAFPGYPYSPSWPKSNESAVLVSRPPSQSSSWEHVPSAWMRRHTRAVGGSRVYKKNVEHCSPAGFVLCWFRWGSPYSSPVDVSYDTFLTGSKHLKVPFTCYLSREGWVFQPPQQRANHHPIS